MEGFGGFWTAKDSHRLVGDSCHADSGRSSGVQNSERGRQLKFECGGGRIEEIEELDPVRGSQDASVSFQVMRHQPRVS